MAHDEVVATVSVEGLAPAGGHTAGLVTDVVMQMVVLMLVAALSTLIIKRFTALPLTVTLVVIGALLAALGDVFTPFAVFSSVELTPDLVLFVFIPTLIFESAFGLDARQLRRNLGPVVALAVPGLLLSTAIIAAIMYLAANHLAGVPMSLVLALLLGSILSATDPVAVIALFKQLGTPERLTVLVEGESLFNDATALVLSKVLLGFAAGGAVTGLAIAEGSQNFFVVFFGGVLVGWLAALLAGTLMAMVETDAFLEITLTTILAYASFVVADHFLHVSGIMAVVAAGITMNSWGRTKISPGVQAFMHQFWEYLAQLANALIFLMVGLMVDFAALLDNALLIGAVIVAMLVSRAAVVFGLLPIVGRLGEPIDRSYQMVMYWGGLRGAIALAIVLALPSGFEYRDQLIAIVIGAVLFTLLVQGLSIEALVKRLRLDQRPLADRLAELEGERRARQRAIDLLPELRAGGLFSARVAGGVEQELERGVAQLDRRLEEVYGALDEAAERRLLVLRCLGRMRVHYRELFAEGHLSEAAYRELDGEARELMDRVRFGAADAVEILVREQGRRRYHWLVGMLGRVPGLGFLVDRIRSQRAVLDYGTAWGRYRAGTRVLDDLRQMSADQHYSARSVADVRDALAAATDRARELIDQTTEQYPEFVHELQERTARRLAARAELDTLRAAGQSGELPEGVAAALMRAKQAEIARLRERSPRASALRASPLELLKKVEFFRDLDTTLFEPIAARLHEHTYPAGEDIIREGERGDSMFLIARGVVRILRGSGDGETELATLMAGDVLGESALLHDAPRNATARTVTPCTAYELARADLDQICADHPRIRAAIERVDRERLSGAGGAQDAANETAVGSGRR